MIRKIQIFVGDLRQTNLTQLNETMYRNPGREQCLSIRNDVMSQSNQNEVYNENEIKTLP